MSEPTWSSGDHYEPFMGRWSALVATQFLGWLDADAGVRWVDVGCGTGALSAAIAGTRPRFLLGIDPAESFVEFARSRVPAASFEVASADDIPLADDSVDLAVSGLVLNFVPDAEAAVAEFARVTRPGGTVAAYVWDYPEMQLLQHFWQTAGELDAAATALFEGARFADWNADRLASLWHTLDGVEVRHLSIEMPFAGFDDYWRPFLGGQGPAPSYLHSLSSDQRDRLRDALGERLPSGAFTLTARAWAVKGIVPSRE